MRIALVSTPRSGNTWLNRLLVRLYAIETRTVHRPDQLIWSELPARCIVQIHWHADDDFLRLLENHGFTYLSIVRHPLDVLLSILHFCQHEPETALWLNGEGGDESSIQKTGPASSAFRNYATGPRAQALLSITPEWTRLPNCTVISYERLVQSPVAELERIRQRFGEFLEPVENAIRDTSMSSMRPHAPNNHFWQGRPGLWAELLPTAAVEALYLCHRQLFVSLGYPAPAGCFVSETESETRWNTLRRPPALGSKDPPSPIREGFISYAQNLEDVMLWRALGHVPNGFYIDVGAQDPRTDSVSRAFYELGWRGLHVEPSRQFAELLRIDRPNETVIEAALGEKDGTITPWEVADTGPGEQAQKLTTQGRHPREVSLRCLTLETIFATFIDRDIHWLKIDVEGREAAVLRGWGRSVARPWVVVVESTTPLEPTPSHHDWEPSLISRGYVFAYFDGLNRFYVSADHPELLPAFSHPPCIFDRYMHSGFSTSPACFLLNRRIAELSDAHNEPLRLRRLLYAASAGQHLYRTWQVLCADERYTIDRPSPAGTTKDYSSVKVPWHAHLCRAIRTLWMPSRDPWHTHLYRTFESLRGNPKYRRI